MRKVIAILWFMLWIAAGLTVFYMFRQVYMTFFGEFRGTHEQEHHLHESPPSMAYVLVVLGALSVFGGLPKIPEFIATFKPFETFLDPVFSSEATRGVMESGIHSHSIEAGFAVLAFIMVVVGWYTADMMYRQHRLDPERFSSMFGGVAYDLVLQQVLRRRDLRCGGHPAVPGAVPRVRMVRSPHHRWSGERRRDDRGDCSRGCRDSSTPMSSTAW